MPLHWILTCLPSHFSQLGLEQQFPNVVPHHSSKNITSVNMFFIVEKKPKFSNWQYNQHKAHLPLERDRENLFKFLQSSGRAIGDPEITECRMMTSQIKDDNILKWIILWWQHFTVRSDIIFSEDADIIFYNIQSLIFSGCQLPEIVHLESRWLPPEIVQNQRQFILRKHSNFQHVLIPWNKCTPLFSRCPHPEIKHPTLCHHPAESYPSISVSWMAFPKLWTFL